MKFGTLFKVLLTGFIIIYFGIFVSVNLYRLFKQMLMYEILRANARMAVARAMMIYALLCNGQEETD